MYGKHNKRKTNRENVSNVLKMYEHMKSMKMDDLGVLGHRIGKVVGLGPGRNLDLGSILGTVVLKPIFQRLAWK